MIAQKEEVKIEVNDNIFYLAAKRFIDVVGSLFGLIVFSPILLIVAILLKLEDKEASVIFAQERNGLNGKVFKMYKFRSMVANAEELIDELQEANEMDGPVFKIKDDPRITKVGRFIRKTSIDEIPQFINVLKGDMSIVGPRPPLPREVACYNDYQWQRLLVKPGITCYWQVNGRNSIGFDEWVELDLKYISERNLFIDLKIILKTALKMFGDEDAS